MARIDLDFAAAYPAAIVDLATGQVAIYGGVEAAEALHARRGGRLYYQSLSGLSGAGWIPAGPTIRRCAVLRTDEGRPRVPNAGEIFPGVRLIVPTRGLGWARRGLVLVLRGQDVFVASGEWELNQLLPAILRGERPEGGREVTLTSWYAPWDGATYQERKLLVTVHDPRSFLRRGLGKLSPRRVLELLLWQELYWPDQVDSEATTPWHSELGLAVGHDGEVYHAAGGILRRRGNVERAVLQEECPWAFFLQDSLDYIVQRDGEFRLVRHAPNEPDWAGRPVYTQDLDPVEVLEAYRTGSLPGRPDVTEGPAEAGSSIPERELEPWERELLDLDGNTAD